MMLRWQSLLAQLVLLPHDGLDEAVAVRMVRERATLHALADETRATLFSSVFEDAVQRCGCSSGRRSFAVFLLLQAAPRASIASIAAFMRRHAPLLVEAALDDGIEPLRLLLEGPEASWRAAAASLQACGSSTEARAVWLCANVLGDPASVVVERWDAAVRSLHRESCCIDPGRRDLRCVSVRGCRDACVFICCPVEAVEVVDCHNVRVVIGVCTGAVRVRDCANVELSSINRSLLIT